VPVEVRRPDRVHLRALRTLISPLLHPLATTGIITIFVSLFFCNEDLLNRLIRLSGSPGSRDLQRNTAVLDDAAGRLGRFFPNSIQVV
jgi:hypothetical protein